MSAIQRWTLVLGLLGAFTVGLFPPETFVWPRQGDNFYIADGRAFLLWPTLGYTQLRLWEGEYGKKAGYERIDYWRLGLEWLVIGALTGAVFLAFHRTR